MTKFIKNLHFYPNAWAKYGLMSRKSSADFIAAWLMTNYQSRGTQVQVSKAVSDDLMNTEFPNDALASDIPWLGQVMEFYFHDNNLPSMLMGKSDIAGAEGYILLALEDNVGLHCTLNMPPDMKLDFIANGEAPPMNYAIPLTKDEEQIMHDMYVLCLKVMVFASIPKYRPLPLTRKMMHQGGKPGVHNRPQRPSFSVVYLPRVITEHETEARTLGKSHTFKGRNGVIRWYRHECFVNRKGTWDYIQPIKNPLTGKYPPPRVVKVRKVATPNEVPARQE